MLRNPLFGSGVTFAYNTLIRFHAASSPSLALSLFLNMRRRRPPVAADHFTFPSVLKACSRLQMGVHLHSVIVKMGFDSDVYVGNALISVYGGCGRMSDALKVFDGMPERDVVSWSSMIASLVDNGYAQEALDMFQRMQIEGRVKPDEVMLLSVVSAISVMGTVQLGRWVDGYISRNGLLLTVALGTALIDMFSRCGSINDSIRVFDRMCERNVRTWTALINGLAIHGRSKEALRQFDDMKKAGFQPDHVTFSAALVACSHGGLVSEGRQIFRSIKEEYGKAPTLENCGCMVDLLGRAGLLDDALKFVEEDMPYKPNAIIWRTLLGACVNRNNLALAEHMKKKLFKLDPYNDGDYVLLSNVYGGTGRYAKKAELRASMQEKRISKRPGHSLLVVGDETHEFLSGDDSHLESQEVRNLLQQLIIDFRVEGYEPRTSSVFHEIEDEEKEQSIGFHSEKLAVAFALVNFSDRRTIRIMKNLRTCLDCHSFMKRVSLKFSIEIVIRDRNRFHHFSNGACSCQDYW